MLVTTENGPYKFASLFHNFYFSNYIKILYKDYIYIYNNNNNNNNNNNEFN